MSNHTSTDSLFLEILNIKRHSSAILRDAAAIKSWLDRQHGLEYTKYDLDRLIEMATAINDDFTNILNALNASDENDEENNQLE